MDQYHQKLRVIQVPLRHFLEIVSEKSVIHSQYKSLINKTIIIRKLNVKLFFCSKSFNIFLSWASISKKKICYI